MNELTKLRDLCEGLVGQRFQSVHDAELALEQFEKLTTPAMVMGLIEENDGMNYQSLEDQRAIEALRKPVSETDYLQDNAAHLALFSLPPIRESAETMPAVQDLPPQQVVTGDKEVDAVLWLRQVISSGQPGPIAAAMEAAKKIATPMKDLEKRYSDYLRTAHQGHFFATFAAIGFGDLEGLAQKSVETLRRRIEAEGRFGGDTIWQDTPAEQFCEMALKRCKGFKDYINYDKPAAHKRFRKHVEVMPHTLDDCLHEIAYWNNLQRLRSATGECGDGQHQAIAREWFVVGLLAEIKPRDKAEALRTLDYAEHAEGLDHDELVEIFRNLLG